MTITEIAKDFTELLEQGHHEDAAEKYNADDIVSYEAMEGPMAICRGMAAQSRDHMSTATSSHCASSST